jgi:hypothetical protein
VRSDWTTSIGVTAREDFLDVPEVDNALQLSMAINVQDLQGRDKGENNARLEGNASAIRLLNSA